MIFPCFVQSPYYVQPNDDYNKRVEKVVPIEKMGLQHLESDLYYVEVYYNNYSDIFRIYKIEKAEYDRIFKLLAKNK